MIPLRLRLRNFMCYREVPELDFTGMHVACLCGENGHGKSALIDAMTWALWGKARASSDDELVRLGSTEMQVDFEFLVEGQLYRVIRKRIKSTPKKRGQSFLQLLVAENGGFRDISANTIAATERKLIDILHLDYQTFINSALLLQGRADEFTTKPPGERKEVLGKILGLSYYDLLEERAREISREKDREKARLESALTELEAELAHKEEYEQELRQVNERLAKIQAELEKGEERLQELRKTKEQLDLKRQELTSLEQRLKQAEEELKFWEEQMRRHEEKIRQEEGIIARGEEIEEKYTELVGLKKQNEELNRRLAKLAGLNEERAQLESQIARAEASLQAEQRQLQEKLKELEARSAERQTLESALEQIRLRLEEVFLRERELAGKREREKELFGRISQLNLQNKSLEADIKSLQDKIALLGREEGTHCPLCDSEIGEEGRRKILQKYRLEQQEKQELYRSNKSELQNLIREHEHLRREIASLESQVARDKEEWQRRKATLESKLAEVERAAEEGGQIQARLSKLEEKLRNKDFAPQERERLSLVLSQIEGLAYDQESHRLIQERIAALEGYEEHYQRLKEARKQIEEEREALKKAAAAAERWQHLLETESRGQELLRRELVILPDVEERLAEAERDHQMLLKLRQEEAEHLGAAKQKLDRCALLERERAEKTQALRRIAEEKGIYDELALAFGKKGIQALIIDYVCPEIEEEANRLLGRMTDGRLGLKLETQRETKKGEKVETLEIRIWDELGTRNYDLYSGGEAFRINLALRLALSKLLARRAGARLPTLIIDEGFGTQDGSGRERLVDAINSIQEDFDKILVITHIEELKEAFPVRLEVTKTEEGSQVRIIRT